MIICLPWILISIILFAVKKPPGPEVTCILPRHQSGFKEPNPVISFSLHKQSSQNGSVDSVDMLNGDDHNLSHEEASFNDQPIFFRYALDTC